MTTPKLPEPVPNLSTSSRSGWYERIFRFVHGSGLIYNACWEDPRIDRQLLELNSRSRVLMITSAGCNALDYLLDEPDEIVTLDVNPRQNALLELKITLLKYCDYEDFFAIFGQGTHSKFSRIFKSIQRHLSSFSRSWWDSKKYYFQPRGIRKSFYYHGGSGLVAWMLGSVFVRSNPKIYSGVQELVNAPNMESQKRIYEGFEEEFWNCFMKFIVRQPLLLSMLGVPKPQLELIQKHYPGGIVRFISDKLKSVFTNTLMSENYFWRVYLMGSYSEQCCPNYLKYENFNKLRSHADRIQIHSMSLIDYLQKKQGTFSHFALLDHQDWLAWHNPSMLYQEWYWLLKRSQTQARLLLRSAAQNLAFLPSWVFDKVTFHTDKTEPAHLLDRVGTYGSLHLGLTP